MFRIISITLALLLTGCVGLAVKGAQTASSQAQIAVNEDAANGGDKVAQYKVGMAHCCSVGPVDPLHDSVKATLWLCRAARQDYAPAQSALGQIYAGHPVVGFDPQQSAKLALAGAPVNRPVARLWLARAAAAGDKDAIAALAKLTPTLTTADLQTSDAYAQNWQAAPCDYRTVFPTGTAS